MRTDLTSKMNRQRKQRKQGESENRKNLKNTTKGKECSENRIKIGLILLT